MSFQPPDLREAGASGLSAAAGVPVSLPVAQMPAVAGWRYRLWYWSLHQLENVAGPGRARGGLQWPGNAFALEHVWNIPGSVQVYPPGGIVTAPNAAVAVWIVTSLPAGQQMRATILYTIERA